MWMISDKTSGYYNIYLILSFHINVTSKKKAYEWLDWLLFFSLFCRVYDNAFCWVWALLRDSDVICLDTIAVVYDWNVNVEYVIGRKWRYYIYIFKVCFLTLKIWNKFCRRTTFSLRLFWKSSHVKMLHVQK